MAISAELGNARQILFGDSDFVAYPVSILKGRDWRGLRGPSQHALGQYKALHGRTWPDRPYQYSGYRLRPRTTRRIGHWPAMGFPRLALSFVRSVRVLDLYVHRDERIVPGLKSSRLTKIWARRSKLGFFHL